MDENKLDLLLLLKHLAASGRPPLTTVTFKFNNLIILFIFCCFFFFANANGALSLHVQCISFCVALSCAGDLFRIEFTTDKFVLGNKLSNGLILKVKTRPSQAATLTTHSQLSCGKILFNLMKHAAFVFGFVPLN